ncbi:unnamed protein product [Paramecium octaurelia]|uniref:Uncharacterized protein n=1 Tax=Paramecium octaurelia TaxID=43137 RepID=A0A8S1WD50_PAROT|nr:unnamed protein product [Paramecium octaurelia]
MRISSVQEFKENFKQELQGLQLMMYGEEYFINVFEFLSLKLKQNIGLEKEYL